MHWLGASAKVLIAIYVFRTVNLDTLNWLNLDTQLKKTWLRRCHFPKDVRFGSRISVSGYDLYEEVRFNIVVD